MAEATQIRPKSSGGRALTIAANVLRRLLHLILVLFLVTVATFFMLELVPGDPAIAVLGTEATPQQYEAVRTELGLDKPAPERFKNWLGEAVRGDLGSTIVPPKQEVSSMIKSRLPVTIELTLVATVLAVIIALPLAMWSAFRAGTRVDRVIGTMAFGVISVPSFLSALLLIFFFVFRPGLVRQGFLIAGIANAVWMLFDWARKARGSMLVEDRLPTLIRAIVAAAISTGVGLLLWRVWPSFPRQGFVRWTADEGKWENIRSVFLPALTLALIEGAVFLRVLRSDIISTLQEDYVLAARAKGMPNRHILFREVLRPSSFSLITVAGVSLGRLFGGAVVVEAIFRLPGMGSLIVLGVNNSDFPIVQGAVLVIAVMYVSLNLLVDISYGFLDPRVRRAGV